ncbi:MAG: hypothetical protein PW788_04825 [Micavibrio sp.]|nr:hypothetical protein [Micavibrio sp.]
MDATKSIASLLGKTADGSPAQQSLLARLRAENAAQYKAVKDKLDAQNQLVQQLESGKKDLRTQQKETAREKLAAIRQQLQSLQLAGNDPATLKQIARLSRELAAARQSYAAAAGNTGADATAPSTADDADFNQQADSAAGLLRNLGRRQNDAAPESVGDTTAETGQKTALSDIII